MLAYTRERIVAHLHEMPPLIDLYQRHNPLVIDKSIDWLDSVEKSLMQLRNPLASFVATERGKIIATSDGYRDDAIALDHRSKRKVRMATTAVILSRVEESLHRLVIDIDEQFSDWRERMAQFIAVATNNSNGIPLPPTEPREQWLKSVWQSFTVTPETRGMYNYLNTAINQTDRLYLLNELIENLINGQDNG
jgi:hypothetical protein